MCETKCTAKIANNAKLTHKRMGFYVCHYGNSCIDLVDLLCYVLSVVACVRPIPVHLRDLHAAMLASAEPPAQAHQPTVRH